MSEKITYVLEDNIPLEPPADASDVEKHAYKKWLDDFILAKCYMLASMTNELQRQHEKLEARDILTHLKELYEEQSRIEWYEISKKLFRAKMAEESSV